MHICIDCFKCGQFYYSWSIKWYKNTRDDWCQVAYQSFLNRLYNWAKYWHISTFITVFIKK